GFPGLRENTGAAFRQLRALERIRLVQNRRLEPTCLAQRLAPTPEPGQSQASSHMDAPVVLGLAQRGVQSHESRIESRTRRTGVTAQRLRPGGIKGAGHEEALPLEIVIALGPNRLQQMVGVPLPEQKLSTLSRCTSQASELRVLGD